MSILVTGGAGYIGTHTVIELQEAGYDIVVVDNLCNSKEESLNRVKEITGKNLTFYNIDMADYSAAISVFEKHKFEAAIHFAGYKAVGESTQKPLEYYENNLVSTLNLCKLMREFGCKNLVFSSSATVYGDPASVPIFEDFPQSATNPYGRTKLYIEQILRDIAAADDTLNVALLRYFNPIGAHESGKIGEDPNGIPNNLMPYITQVAIGKLEKLGVFGDDYDTVDGTGVRDYVHVVDLAKGHVKAVGKLINDNPGCCAWNLGTGKGNSVLEVIAAFSKACGKNIPYQILPRRSGDVPMCYADCSKAEKELGWKAEYDINRMCEDSWRWQSNNPDGYTE